MKQKSIYILNLLSIIVLFLLGSIKVIGVDYNQFHQVNNTQNVVLEYIDQPDQSLPSSFTIKEKQHLKQVANLVKGLKISLVICGLLWILTSIWIIKKRQWWTYSYYSIKKLILILLGVLITGLLIYTNFYHFWNRIHQIIFPNGNWYFTKGVMIDNFSLAFFKKVILQISLSFISLYLIWLSLQLIIVRKGIKE